MRTYARVGGLLLMSFFGAPWVMGQQPAPSAPPVQAGSSRMYLDVVVTPKSGAPVSGLQQQDFTLLDNKVSRAITSFRAPSGRDAPVDVILVIDDVNDTAENVGYERAQIDKFLRADGGSLKYPLALAVFTDTRIEGLSKFSTDGNALSDALDKSTIGLRDIGKTAAYWGAAERLQLSVAALGELVASESSRPERKVIVWVSPGWPLLYSRQADAGVQKNTFENIVRMSAALQQARVTLYDVDPLGAGQSAFHAMYYRNFLQGISKPSQTQLADMSLQVLAVQSGGLVLNFSNNVASLIAQSIADIGPYYELSFEPSASEKPSEYHRLDVRVAGAGLVAHTRQGYYAQPSAHQ